MEVHLSPVLEGKLARLAASQGRSTETIVEEALEKLVDYEDWFLREVDRGVACADRGEFVGNAEVREMIDRRYPG